MYTKEKMYNKLIKGNCALYDYDMKLIEKYLDEIYADFDYYYNGNGMNEWDAVEQAVIDMIIRNEFEEEGE